MTIYLWAVLIGVVAGSRTMMAPTAVSWAAALGWLNLNGTPLSFLGLSFTPWIFTILALGELVADQLPSTPSRKTPPQFGARIVSGALSGAALAAPAGMLVGGALAGVVGAIIGTFGGAYCRARLANMFDRDRPAATIESVAAIALAALIVTSL